MAKQSGLGDRFFVGGYNVSGDIQALGGISAPMATLPSTGIDKSAMERLPGLRDGSMEFTTYFNRADDQVHEALSSLPRGDVMFTYCRSAVLGAPTAMLVAKLAEHTATRGDDGQLTFQAAAKANSFGLEWGKQLTAGQRTDTAATNGTGVDFGTGSTAFGLQAYLQVFSFTGTSVTVSLEESSDNGVGDPWTAVTGGTFTAATGRTTQRIATASNQTVERYLRVVTTGTFTSAVFAVGVNRNSVAVSF